MGLLNTKPDKQLINGLTITYSVRKITGTWSWTMLNVTSTIEEAWEYHRYAKCSYKYVGLSYSAAKIIARDLIDAYTREFQITKWQTIGEKAGTFDILYGGDKLQGDISINKINGHMYEVVVNINEDDCKVSKDQITAIEMFADENSREYDY